MCVYVCVCVCVCACVHASICVKFYMVINDVTHSCIRHIIIHVRRGSHVHTKQQRARGDAVILRRRDK